MCGVGSTRDSGTSPNYDYDSIGVLFMKNSQEDSFGNLFYDALVERLNQVIGEREGSIGTAFIFNFFGDPSLNCWPK